LLQGIPVGLSFGSIPFLLKSRLSYSQIAIFSLSSWPYSLKLLWSPVVDSVYWPNIGRRTDQRSCHHLHFLHHNLLLCHPGHRRRRLGPHSTFEILLVLRLDRTDHWPQHGLLPVLHYIPCSQLSRVLKQILQVGAERARDRCTPIGKLHDILGSNVFRDHGVVDYREKGDMKSFILVLLTAKIGFIANESVTGLKLLEKGFSKEDLALAVLVDFPFQILFGYYAAKWSSGPRPLKPVSVGNGQKFGKKSELWLYAFYGRLFFAAAGMAVVNFYPADGHASTAYFWIIIASTVLSSFMSTVQFVSISAFMTTIADPLIGGTYMTLLNTFSNFGGTWPKFFVLEAVDFFTVATCDKRKADESSSCH
ncbi:acetyl-coenzyme A transporter 1-domain-containing protein, partial [Endogone sp. FLAS-F59071]